jgi:hypothetical protein
MGLVNDDGIWRSRRLAAGRYVLKMAGNEIVRELEGVVRELDDQRKKGK